MWQLTKKLCLDNGTESDVVAVARAPADRVLKEVIGDRRRRCKRGREGGRRLTNADGCYELVTSPQGDR